MGIRKDLTGLKYNHLIVLGVSHQSKNGKTYWKCKCDFDGNEIIVQGYNLISGKTKSCGCLQKRHPNASKHKLSNARLYHVWFEMKNRCYNPKSNRYYTHGARGIKVCPEWLDKENGLINFYEYVSKLPHFNEKDYSLDRINNDGNYEPNNVKWSNDIEQANNKRNNHRILFNGEEHTVSEWSRITGISRQTIVARIDKYNWTIERALTEKPIKGKK